MVILSELLQVRCVMRQRTLMALSPLYNELIMCPAILTFLRAGLPDHLYVQPLGAATTIRALNSLALLLHAVVNPSDLLAGNPSSWLSLNIHLISVSA
jgi:hypothetical protein